MKTAPVMHARILGHLNALYGQDAAAGLLERLDVLLRAQSVPGEARVDRPLTERDAMLITYGDQIREPGVAPLRTLAAAGARWWRDLVSAVHILPFYPYSSDDGFSVKDFHAVDPALGGWDDVRGIAADFELMFDAVFNHMSARSEWFRRFLAGDPEFEDFFVTVDGDPDLSGVVRPRALPLLTEFESARGMQKVWTTFSADQVDLNVKNPEVLLRLVEVLLFYVVRGARWIRLDAIAYLWKQLGTACIHLPQTHRIIQLMRAILDDVAPGVRLITETNVPHPDNISYFGNGTNQAQLVYNFALPPLVLHAIRTGDATALTSWAQGLTLPSNRVTFFNFLASHDGIGLNPARGILAPDEIEALVHGAVAHGGYVSHKNNPDGSRSPYELNINYFDALSDPDGGESIQLQVARFLCAQSILLTLQGLPGIYVHSLLGSRGDRAAAEQSGIPRRINRAKLDRPQLERELNQPDSLRARVFDGFSRMLRARRQQAAFCPSAPQKVCSPRPGIVVIRRGEPEADGAIWCVHNLGARESAIDWPTEDAVAPEEPHDVSGAPVQFVARRIRLRPYEVLWLKASK
jgi:glucosylglycerate phosphorylase